MINLSKEIVQIDLTGREFDSKKVFETTSKEVALKEGINTTGKTFKPVTILLGAKELFPKLEETIKNMKEKETKTIILEPKDAFGERKSELIRVLPLKQFKDNKLNPFPGLIIDADGLRGRVQTVSGGRVRVDFNNDLAGKKLEYTITLIKKIIDVKEKTKAIIEKYLPIPEVTHSIEKNKVIITMPKGMPKEIQLIKTMLEKQVKEVNPEIKEIEYKELEEKKTTKDKVETIKETKTREEKKKE